MYGSIYCATNSANGKKYVGKTTYGLVLRWRYHLREARSGSPGPLYAAIRKYGEGTFKIEYLASADSQEELDLMEIRYIAELQTLAPLGYNLASGGAGSGKHSQETRRKMSDSHLGKVATAATRENMSKAMKGRTITLASTRRGDAVGWKDPGRAE